MSTKRDFIGEIVAKRRNARRGKHVSFFIDRIFELFDALEFLRTGDAAAKAVRYDLLRHVSVSLVAAMEGYYRMSIRNLIDRGEPFRSNATRLTDLRLDVSVVVALQSSKVSLGEFVAHLLPMSSITDVNRHMSTLIGEDYFARLKKTHWRGDSETYAEAHPRAWEALEQLFQDRHIACHELSPKQTPTFKRARGQWRTVCILAFADEALIDELLRPPT